MGLENRIHYDSIDVAEGRCTLQQALVRDSRADFLYLLPAAQTRDKTDISADQMCPSCKQLTRPLALNMVFPPLLRRLTACSL